MTQIPRCLMLPIDGSDESLKPIEFVKRLYRDIGNINIVLSYFVPPLPPVYTGTPHSETMMQRKRELMSTRREGTKTIFSRARAVLKKAGFQESMIQDHIQEKRMGAARHACLLADVKKVDAILVQKRICSSLEGFLKDDPTSELLQHCLMSPVWMVDGEVRTSGAAVCVRSEIASLRAADHVAFMLSETDAQIILLHVSKAIQNSLSSGVDDLDPGLKAWLQSSAGKEIAPYLMESAEMFKKAGFETARLSIVVIPAKTNTAQDILSYCAQNGLGMAALGHSRPEGALGWLKGSVTKKILAEFRNMAVLVNQ